MRTTIDSMSNVRRHGARETCIAAVLAVCLWAGTAFAGPSVTVRYIGDVARIELDGQWPNSRYTVLRSMSAGALGEAITAADVPCLGSCFVDDLSAEPGKTYYYRFHLVLPDGDVERFGPFAVTVSNQIRRVRGTLSPNPLRGPATLELFLAGDPAAGAVSASAELIDLQGRRVATLARGEFPRGLSRLAWNGRRDDGRELGPGAYFLRVSSPIGSQVTRVLRRF
jgi:hypothetical protein